jgi:hypothetical protein
MLIRLSVTALVLVGAATVAMPFHPLGTVPLLAQAQAPASPRSRILADASHGQPMFRNASGELTPLHERYAAMAQGLAADFEVTADKPTRSRLEGYRTVVLMAPLTRPDDETVEALIGFVQNGGSLLIGLDEERRQKLEPSRVNDIVRPFGLSFTADTPYIHNRGALAVGGRLNQTNREIPYSGGRAVAGGTPFSFVINPDGTPSSMAHAAWVELPSGGRIVAMGDLMAPLLLGQPEGQRMFGGLVPGDSVYWGRDSAAFMTEVLAWLTNRLR